MPATVTNPRDLVVQQLGELLYVERRLADVVLRDLAHSVGDEELRTALERHLEETRTHVERVETAFRRLEVAPASIRSAPFEALVEQHERLAGSIEPAGLADVHHAAVALRTEHEEIAAYTALLTLADAAGRSEAVTPLVETLREEEAARAALEGLLPRLAEAAVAR